jgi:hypothetical protein
MTENAAESIVCPVTAWYHKRKIAMILLLLGLSAFFFYDWKVGYPKKAADYEAYWPEYQRLVLKEKKTAEWFKLAKEKGWPDKPHEEDWDYKIKEQLVFGVITGLIGAGMLGQYLVNSKKTLTADADSFTTPDGIRVPFVSAFKLDKRKWDNKGLAYVNYQNGDESGKVVIDCLVYGDPAIKVLERLEANFKGEIIDVVKEVPAAAEEAAAVPDDTTQP